MQYVYKFILNTDINTRRILLWWCRASKNLYNQSLYEIKKSLKDENKFLFYSDLEKMMKSKQNLEGDINYRLVGKAQVAQQCIKTLDKSLKRYFKANSEYKKNPSKFLGKPKLPNYCKEDVKQLIFTNQACSIKQGKIFFNKATFIKIPQYDKYKNLILNFNQIRVNPKYNGEILECEIIYTVENNFEELDYDRYSSIDLGVDNLVTLVNDYSNPIIYSGKQVKSINQYFNKEISIIKGEVKKSQNKNTSKKLVALNDKRNKQINDIFHKVSRHIVNQLIKNKVGNLVVGYNKEWKDSINLGHKTNQTFVQIPYLKLINYLKYKCEKVGIKFQTNEESYTSKCDSLSLEKIGKHEDYLGKRIKRGLFQSSTCKLINADVNGSLNIMRKVVDDSYVNKIFNSGSLFLPLKFKNLYDLRTL